MARPVDTPYLDPRALVENYQARSTPLEGVRRFYAGEGLVVFADDKNGMNAVGGEVWLRPAATRRIGSYLDLQRPVVVGFRLTADPTAPERLPGATPTRLFDAFCEVAEATRGVELGGDRGAELVSSHVEGKGPWGWRGSVSYEYVQRLARGQRTVGHAEVSMYAREAVNGTVEVAVVLNRQPEDLEIATKWLRWAFALRDGNWHIEPVGLPESREERFEVLRDVLTELNKGQEAPVASPGFHRLPPLFTEVTDADAEDEGPSESFLNVLRSSAYRTDMTSVDVVAERMGVDASAISALNVYLSRKAKEVGGKGDDAVVIALRLRQIPRQDPHLQVGWHAGKGKPDGSELTADEWESWPSITWDLDRKRTFLLAEWQLASDALGRQRSGAQDTAAEA